MFYSRTYAVFAVPLIALVIASIGCTSQPTTAEEATVIAEEEKTMTHAEMIDRGEYLVKVGDCAICHTPKKMGENGPEYDRERWLSGHASDQPLPPIDPAHLKPGGWNLMSPGTSAFVGPWGVSFAYNITPDIETGIGGWDFETFERAIKNGQHMGSMQGRPIMPPMPWQAIAEYTDEDLRSLFAYLKSIKPIKNKIPDYIPPDQLATSELVIAKK